MEGNGIVNPCSNSISAEVVAQRVALLRPNYKQMEYMFSVSRYFWWYDGGLCKRRRHLCSMFAAEAVPLIKLAQLDGEYRCLDAIQAAILSVKQKSTRLNSSHLVISYAVFC